MSKKAIKRIFIGLMILALVVVPLLAIFSEAGSEVAYEVPRMLGMESEKGEVARLEGPPTTDVVGPIVETHRPAVSFDHDLRDLPQTGPKDKKPAREMGTPPNAGPNGDGFDAVAAIAVLKPWRRQRQLPRPALQVWTYRTGAPAGRPIRMVMLDPVIIFRLSILPSAFSTRRPAPAWRLSPSITSSKLQGWLPRIPAPNIITVIRSFSTTRFPAAGSSPTSPLPEQAHRPIMNVSPSPRLPTR